MTRAPLATALGTKSKLISAPAAKKAKSIFLKDWSVSFSKAIFSSLKEINLPAERDEDKSFKFLRGKFLNSKSFKNFECQKLRFLGLCLN